MSAALPLGWRIRASLTVVVVPPLLSLVSFSKLGRWLGGEAGPAARAPAYQDDEMAEWVDRLLYRLAGPWRHTCLKRSAVLYDLLRRDGREVELCIGVRRNLAGAIAAHAWLLRGGVPYLERNAESPADFQIIARFPESRRNGLATES